MKKLLLAIIGFYRRFISPLKPPSCRFSPTCSDYAQMAIKRYGVFKGSILAAWRVTRCNPFSKGGHDPVPERYTTRRKVL